MKLGWSSLLALVLLVQLGHVPRARSIHRSRRGNVGTIGAVFPIQDTIPLGALPFFPISAQAVTQGNLPILATMVTAFGGGTIWIMPCRSILTLPDAPQIMTGTNMRIIFDTGAQFTPSATNTGIWNGGGNQRYPCFVYSRISNVTVEGGWWTSSFTSPNYQVIHYPGDNCAGLKIRGGYYYKVRAWPILCEGTWTTVGSNQLAANYVSPHGGSGPVTNFTEEGNIFETCGFSSAPDGGGCRLANSSGQVIGGTQYINVGASLGRGTRILNSLIFGYDILNGPEAGWQKIVIHDPYIDFNTAGTGPASSPEKIGINFENSGVVAGSFNGDIVIENPTIRNAYHAVHAQDGWTYITIVAGTYELSYSSGLNLGASNGGAMNWLTIVAPTVKNNNQGGGAGAAGNVGLQIGIASGANSSVSHVDVLGGTYVDDQASPTQNYGVAFLSAATGASLAHVRSRLTSRNFSGNVDGTIFWGTAGSGTFTDCLDEYPYVRSTTGLGSAQASFLTVTPPSSGFYDVSIELDVTAESGAVTGTVAYTDTNGNPQSRTLATITGTSAIAGVQRIYAGGGAAITIATTLGATATYAASACIKGAG